MPKKSQTRFSSTATLSEGSTQCRFTISLTGAFMNSLARLETESSGSESLIDRCSRYAASRFIQSSALVPNASASPLAVSGVTALRPEMIWLIVFWGLPRISARSDCVQPRASSSSRTKSPGGKTSAGVRFGIVILPSVVILNSADDDDLLGSMPFELEDQPPLVI